MKYQLTDYKGNILNVTPEQAAKIADVAELLEIEVDGQKHYLNPKNIASITPTGITPDQARKLFPHRFTDGKVLPG